MKRIGMAFLAFALALSAFADEDEDRVLSEARRRAARNREARETASDRSDEAEDDRGVYLPIAIAVLPGSPIPGTPVDTSLGLGLIIGAMRDVEGAQFSLIGSVATGSVNGIQASYVFSVTEGDVNGLQAANIFNVAQGEVSGLQAAGIFNVAEGSVGGGQMAGIFNVSAGGGPVQLAGVFNVAEGDFHGVQAAGIFNVADKVSGVQSACIFNVATELRGVQIGLVNIADTAYGFQLGLVNIVHNGINDMGFWIEDSGWAYGFWQKGSSNVYTLAYLGAPKEDWFESDDRLAGGLGLGFRIGGYRRWDPAVDFDVSAKGRIDLKALRELAEHEAAYRPQLFPSVRASLRMPVGLGLAIHAGIVLDAEFDDGPSVDQDFRVDDPWDARAFGREWIFHPKLFAGLSF